MLLRQFLIATLMSSILFGLESAAQTKTTTKTIDSLVAKIDAEVRSKKVLRHDSEELGEEMDRNRWNRAIFLRGKTIILVEDFVVFKAAGQRDHYFRDDGTLALFRVNHHAHGGGQSRDETITARYDSAGRLLDVTGIREEGKVREDGSFQEKRTPMKKSEIQKLATKPLFMFASQVTPFKKRVSSYSGNKQ